MHRRRATPRPPPHGSRAIAMATLAAAATLALAATTPASAAVYGGALHGVHDPLVLTTDPTGRILGAVASWTGSCESGSLYAFHHRMAATGPAAPLRRLRMERNEAAAFAGTYEEHLRLPEGDAVVTMRLEGRLDGPVARGTLHGAVTLTARTRPGDEAAPADPLLDRCRTGAVRFTLRSEPGIVYGGSTGQNEPLVLRLSPDRTRVARVAVGWHARCRPGGYVDYPEAFTRFPIRGGRFGAAFTHAFPSEAGGENVFAYTLRGRIGARTASGRFSARVTFPDESRCATGGLRWTAASG